MAQSDRHHPQSGVLHDLASLAGRAAASTLRPLSAIVDATLEAGASLERRAVEAGVSLERRALEAGVSLERRAVDRVLDSDELARTLGTAFDNTHVQAAVARALQSEGARRLVDSFFDSSLFDQVIDRLLASDALWRLVDEVADSPSVTAAISQQGLGFADQVGDEVRARSRRADEWLERVARRLSHREAQANPARPDPSPG